MTLQSTINDSTYYNSEEDDAESDPKSDQLVATHTSDGKKGKVADTNTTNRNSSQTILIDWFIPELVPVIIPPIDPRIANGVVGSGGTLHARQTITSKEIIMDATRSSVCVLQDPMVLKWKDRDRKIPRYGNTSGSPPILTTPVRIGGGPSASPTIMGSQEIGSSSGSIGPEEFSNA